MMIERILLPTDFSELSVRAARVARSLAKVTGATVHLLHVCTPVEVALPCPEVGVLLMKCPPDETDVRNALSNFARRYVEDDGVQVVTAIAKGKPAREIARYAKEARIDRIVIGTHARGIVQRILHGSVSKSVLEHSPCAVVMVPPVAALPSEDGQSQHDFPPGLVPGF